LYSCITLPTFFRVTRFDFVVDFFFVAIYDSPFDKRVVRVMRNAYLYRGEYHFSRRFTLTEVRG
jgi:hypothetical protein